MRIEQFKYLLHIAETGSISRSAEELCISQQGLSQSIQQMERELCTKLLLRENNRTQLTVAGKRVLENVKVIIDNYDHLVGSLSGEEILGKQKDKTCCIHATPRTCVTMIPGVVRQFSRHFPKMGIKIMEHSLEEIFLNLDFSKPEIFVFNTPDFFLKSMLDERPEIRFKELRRDKIMAVVPNNAKYKSIEVLTFDNLYEAPLAILGGDDIMLSNLSGIETKEMKIMLHTTNFELYKEVLNGGNVVGFCSGFIEKWVKPSTAKIIPMEKSVEIVSGYIENEYINTNPIAVEVANMLQDQFKKADSKNH